MSIPTKRVGMYYISQGVWDRFWCPSMSIPGLVEMAETGTGLRSIVEIGVPGLWEDSTWQPTLFDL